MPKSKYYYEPNIRLKPTRAIRCVLDTGSSISIIPKHFIKQYNIPSQCARPIEVQQTEGKILLRDICNLEMRIGNVTTRIQCYILDTNLPYLILGLEHCSQFKLNIHCSTGEVIQNNISIKLMSPIQQTTASLHIHNQGGLKVTQIDSNSCQKDESKSVVNRSKIVSHTDNFESKQVPQPPVEEITPQTSQGNVELELLLHRYKHIFSINKYDIGKINIEPPRIELKSELPVSLRPYRTSHIEEVEIRSQVDKLLNAGIIRESYSPYSAPVTLAYKKDEGKKTRMCIDFRKLNEITKTDADPLPRIDCLLDKLSNSKVYSTIDLTSGYWQIPIHPRDTEKLAFATTFGLFEWLRLPFGMKNAPAIFNRTIRRILNKHKINFACNYFDDIIVYSSSETEHLEHLKKFFTIFEQENIKLKMSKCKFMQSTINFLGYEIQNGSVTPDNVNIESIKKLKVPTNVKELQRFLGSVNVYHKFIQNYASIRLPLNNLLKKNVKWDWTQKCQDSFELLKNKLISKPILQLHNPKMPCHLFVDASQYAVGAVLKQPDACGNLHPIAYFSRTLKKYETNYPITELECLTIVDCLDKFYHYLHGTKFTIHTDHAALVWLKNFKNPRGRLFRWSLKLSMFDYEIKYNKGSTNFEADMLSRHPVSQHLQPCSHLLDIQEIKQHQESENVCDRKYKLHNDVFTIQKKGLIKIVVPMSLRLTILKRVHEEFGHPGSKKMLSIISPQYYWPHITEDVTKYAKHCVTCQLNKKPRQKKFGLMQEVPPTDRPFECLSLDTVGGFNYYNSTKKYLHIIIDHATRYIWAFPSKSVTTETYANCLSQIFKMQTPEKLLTDRNAAFTSSKFRRFLERNNVKQLLTSSHHPQTNGKVERVNQTIVTRLKCKVNTSSAKTPWTKLLEQVISEYNNTPHTVTGYTPAYLLFGTLPYPPVVNDKNYYPPVDQARVIARERTIKYHSQNKIRYDVRFVKSKFKIGDKVIYEDFQYPNTRKLTQPFSGPYTILKKLSDVNYVLDKHNYHTGQTTEVVHASKLRHYFDPANFKMYHEN